MAQRRTQLELVESKRNELSLGLQTHNELLNVLPKDKQEDFKKNFLELATQDYLLSIIDVKEIVRFAVNITKIGLDIAPSSNEVYIIPFDTKVNGTKVMLPQAIIPFNGMQQLAYKSGFMLTVDPVYKFTETDCEAARNLSRIQQSKLNTANPQWLDKHFIGYDVILKDLVGNLGEQVYFVDVSYVKAATKTNKDAKWSLSTWTHKAVRKAYKQFLVPRDRALEAFEKLEHLNDAELIDTDIISTVTLTPDIENAVQQLGLSLDKQGGTAIVVGQTFGKDKTLKSLGFVYNNKSWTMEYVENTTTQQNTSTKPATPVAAEKPQAQAPAHLLMKFLKDNGLTQDQIASFVKEGLQLDSSNSDGINAELANKDALLAKVQAFLNPIPEKQSDDVNVDEIF